MPRTHLRLRLRPSKDDGGSTWISLSGPLPTEAGSAKLRRLLTSLAVSTGQPIRIVLSAADLVGWGEIWLRELELIPERHRQVRFRARRRRIVDDDQLDLFGRSR